MESRAPSQTDAQLVTAALQGSPEAHRLLVERYQGPVLALIDRMVRDRALAEDLAQEAFVRAFGHLPSYDLERPFKSWLFKIAHNRAIDHLRLRRPQWVALEASSSDGEESWEVLEAPREQSPDRQAESAELGRVIEESIGALRENYRQVLLLRFQGGLAYHEIADTLGITMASVKVQLHRARKALAAELARRGLEAPEAFR